MPEIGSLTIVHYHRFQGRQTRVCLAAQCVWLTHAYDVVSIDEAIAGIDVGAVRVRPMAVVCVDDGHGDFYSVGFPTFREYGINAICYLVTDFVDGTDWLWGDKVTWLASHTGRQRITLDLPGPERLECDLTTMADRMLCARILKERMKAMPNGDRIALLHELPRAFDVRLPAAPPDAYRAITWTEAREMSAAGASFGVHTRTHPILSMLPEPERIAEIVESRNRCEAELGVPARHFCYPNGRPADIGERTPEILRAHGFETAVTTSWGVNTARTDRLRLHRIWVEPYFSLTQFQDRLAGRRPPAA